MADETWFSLENVPSGWFAPETQPDGWFSKEFLDKGASNDLVGVLFTNTNTFGSGVVSTVITASGVVFSDTDSFGTGSVTTVINLTGILYSDSDSFGAGVISLGSGNITLTGTLYSDSDSFPLGVVSTSTNITGVLYIDGDVYGSGSLAFTSSTDYTPYFSKYPIQHHWYNKDGLILSETEYKDLIVYLTKWYTVNARNNLIFKINDSSNNHHFARTGGVRVKNVTPTIKTYLGTFNSDNSLNIVIDTLDTLGKGPFHSSGALRVVPTTTATGVFSPTGGLYGEVV